MYYIEEGTKQLQEVEGGRNQERGRDRERERERERERSLRRKRGTGYGMGKDRREVQRVRKLNRNM